LRFYRGWMRIRFLPIVPADLPRCVPYRAGASGMISYWLSESTTWTKSPSASAVCGVSTSSTRQVPSGLVSKIVPSAPGGMVRPSKMLSAAAARLGVMGGAGSLQTTPGGPLLVETPDFPPAAKPESTAQKAVLDALRATDADVDWFYVSPGASYGQNRTPHRTGKFRVGGDVLLVDADGRSTISAEDLAVAVVDEIERPAHHRERFTVSS